MGRGGVSPLPIEPAQHSFQMGGEPRGAHLALDPRLAELLLAVEEEQAGWPEQPEVVEELPGGAARVGHIHIDAGEGGERFGLLKDVVARENIRNVAFLENLVTYLVDNTGNLFSALNISKYLKSQNIKMPTQTVLNYLHALTNAFFVYRTPRIDVNGLKIFEIGEKYYFEDLGLRNAIRVFNPKSDINKLMENAVFMHLMRNGYDVFVGNNEGKEIDFVAIRNNERIYIQVAYMLYDQRTIDREFGNLMEIENHYPKYVVTMDTLPMSASYQGIQQVHLRTFLSNDTI